MSTVLYVVPRTIDGGRSARYNKLYDIYQIICFKATELKRGETMEIKRLEREAYAGSKFTARYQTQGYYDICAGEGGFCVKYTLFGKTEERSFDAVFFGE